MGLMRRYATPDVGGVADPWTEVHGYHRLSLRDRGGDHHSLLLIMECLSSCNAPRHGCGIDHAGWLCRVVRVTFVACCGWCVARCGVVCRAMRGGVSRDARWCVARCEVVCRVATIDGSRGLRVHGEIAR